MYPLKYIAPPEQRDLEAVTGTAAWLQISEFELFQTAYCTWFGKRGPERIVEGFFSAYMLENTVPHWVRHFVRAFARGEQIPKACALRQPEIDPALRFRGIGYGIVLVLVMAGFCLLVAGWTPPV